MFKPCYEVVSVSKKNGEVVFRSSEWFNEDETLDRVEVGYVGIEIVRVSKVERSRKITAKTNENFEVGQKFSYFEFRTLPVTDVKYGALRKTGKTVSGIVENRVMSCDSYGLWQSDKIEIEDAKKMIALLNKMVESAQ